MKPEEYLAQVFRAGEDADQEAERGLLILMAQTDPAWMHVPTPAWNEVAERLRRRGCVIRSISCRQCYRVTVEGRRLLAESEAEG